MMPVMELEHEIQLDTEKSYEFVNGQWEEKEMPGARHSGVCGRLTHKLREFVASNDLGEVYPEASFQIGENERIPDLAFVSAARIPAEGEPETKWPMPPDLAIEIVSPSDFYDRVYAKAMEYLTAGVKQVWVISPENQVVTIYRSPTNIIAFPLESELVSEDLLPGFRCPLREIFFRRTPSVQ
ncbi:MAG TPA: Uma2 family endonuclease [Blastocatellia bacterium]|nr:Uma2 family endonuclease [Blastocatellia bacterium]HMV86818.1 Uma2 family endonuclease [Blastocatellia bacterium]HMX24693.1 Uma2 family endonuclease [Blastocatellia bacterium]HMY72725.1 Uma2 family endonuclease [Blastocatellia bacterium]HMZ17789.1 Uma2 family endonuclease [Blastocatellia bacterium]